MVDQIQRMRESLIQLRARDTRPPDRDLVLQLAESIQQLGLIEPIVVDKQKRLLAGRNRLEAIRLALKDSDDRIASWMELATTAKRPPNEGKLDRVRQIAPHPDLKGGMVSVVIKDIDAKKDEAGALAIEIAENQQRKNYTKDEILELAQRLREAGFTEKPGKPRPDERPLKPALASIVGKSVRQIERLLSDAKHESNAGRPRLSEEGGRRNLVLSVDPELETKVRELAKREKRSLASVGRELLNLGLKDWKKGRR